MQGKVADVYRLSPVQEALLMHRLRDPSADSGVVVLRGRLEGPLDTERFAEAWRATVAVHPVLRTSIHWRNLEHPVQVVARTVNVELQVEEGPVDSDLDALADQMRRDGLDIERSPVMTLRVIRVAEHRHLLLWACHHLLLDGWSSGLVLREVMSRYHGIDTTAPRLSFRDYVAWARRRPDEEAAALWTETGVDPRDVLATQPLLPTAGRVRADHRLRRRVELDGLDAWARRHGVTLGASVIAAWAATVAEATGDRRAVIGLTSSGRGVDVDGIDTLVGMATTGLPLWVTVDPDASVATFVETVWQRQQALQPFASWPLDRLFTAAGVTLRHTPFTTTVAFANFPRPDVEGDLTLVDVRGDLTSSSPLTLAMVPVDHHLDIEASFDSRIVNEGEVEALLERCATLLGGMTVDDETTVAMWMGASTSGFRARTDGVSQPARPLGGTDAEAAATPSEAQLMRIWNDLLHVQEYGRNDNFFDLGGTSLLVPSLVQRIEQDFGVRLPLGVVFEDATVAALATVIDGQRDGTDALRWRSLVPIRRVESDSAPLFMVHGLGGEVGWFYNLANYLDPAVPLHGLQSPVEAFDDLVAMARAYVESVREVQPTGPYRLGGYCIGGGVAYEMACQLRAAGETVTHLVLIDSVPQAHITEQQASVGIGKRLRRLLDKDPAEMVRSSRDFARQATQRLVRGAQVVRGARDDRPLELDDVLDMNTLPQVYHEISRRHFRAMRDYEPGSYDGDVWLFRTHDERFGEDFGWGALVQGRLSIERIPGRHVDVLAEPHVQVVGAKLDKVLSADTGTHDGKDSA
ncbi:MAG: condensation domain-containing protein [Acidobacteriota bacterium]